MSLDPTVTRRTVLAAGAGTAGIAVLAACSSSGTDAAPSAGASSDTASGTNPKQPPSSGGDSADSSGSGASTVLATLADVPVGGAIAVDLPSGKPGIVARPTAATAVCFSAICTHEGCTVKPAGKTLDCPCHGSKYNALTGAVLNPPAPSPLAKVSVAVRDGKVVAT